MIWIFFCGKPHNGSFDDIINILCRKQKTWIENRNFLFLRKPFSRNENKPFNSSLRWKVWGVFLSFLFDVLLEGGTKRVIVRVLFSPRSPARFGEFFTNLYWLSPLLPAPRSVESQSLKCSQQLVWKNKI